MKQTDRMILKILRGHGKLNREWTSVLELYYLTREIGTVVEYCPLLCTDSIVFFCLLVAMLH